MSEYKYVVDTQSKVVHARREGRKEGLEKGIQEGRKEGIQEGLQQGIQEGRKEGIQEGGQKKAAEVARKLKSRGVAAEQIAEDTGLSLQQIEGL
jgi:predicted transposase/invertase (TIGR01784 family)